MQNPPSNEELTEIINKITQKLSTTLLKEFTKQDEKFQLNIILIKSIQLLLANILCQVAMNKEELEQLLEEQANDIKELTYNCLHSAFSEKFNIYKH